MDRLDDIWKNTFNDAELIETQGALPSNIVWEGIAAAVEPKKDDKLFFWWILGGALVLLTSLGLYSLLNNQQTITVSSSVTTNVAEVAAKNTTTHTTENANPLVQGNQSKSTNDAAEIKEAAENMTSRLGQETISEKPDAFVENSASKFTQELKNADSTPLKSAAISESLANKSQNHPQLSSPKNRVATDSKLSSDYVSLSSRVGVASANLNASSAFLNTYTSAPSYQQYTKTKALENPELLESLGATLLLREIKTSLSERIFPAIDPVKQSRINTTFEIGAMQWNHRVNDALSNDLSPFDFTYEDDLGWYASLGFAFELNRKLEIFSGLEYGQVQVQSGHNSTLAYSLDDELINQASNEYALNLASPYGFMASEFKFSRTNTLNENAANVLVDFHSTHQIQNVRVPLGMRIKILKFNTWSISANGGFAINRIVSLKNTPADIVIHNNALSFDYESATFGEQDIRAWHGDAFGGLKVSKQIRQNFSLFLGGELSQGLSPIFKQDNYETKISRRYFSLGSALTF